MAGIVTSKLTERSQTTVPKGVRTVLGVRPGDQIGYLIEGTEVRLVSVAGAEHADPALEPFLEFLRADLSRHPERVTVFPREFIARIKALTKHVVIDHDAPIDGAVAL